MKKNLFALALSTLLFGGSLAAVAATQTPQPSHTMCCCCEDESPCCQKGQPCNEPCCDHCDHCPSESTH